MKWLNSLMWKHCWLNNKVSFVDLCFSYCTSPGPHCTGFTAPPANTLKITHSTNPDLRHKDMYCFIRRRMNPNQCKHCREIIKMMQECEWVWKSAKCRDVFFIYCSTDINNPQHLIINRPKTDKCWQWKNTNKMSCSVRSQIRVISIWVQENYVHSKLPVCVWSVSCFVHKQNIKIQFNTTTASRLGKVR